MKTIPTKFDIEHIFEAVNPKRVTKIKLKNDGSAALITLCYLSIAKQIAAETDKLLFLDNKLTMTGPHVLAAAKKVLPKYSYERVVKAKLDKMHKEKSVFLDDIENEENESKNE